MLDEVLIRSFAVFVELNLTIFVVKIQQRIQRVVIQLVIGTDGFGDSFADVIGHGCNLPALRDGGLRDCELRDGGLRGCGMRFWN